MYAVIQTGGHQVRVAVGEVVRVARLAEEVGSQVVFDDVLLVGGDHDVKVGTPTIDGAKVSGTVVSQDRDRKVLIYTYKKRQNSNRKQAGHRQPFTSVKIVWPSSGAYTPSALQVPDGPSTNSGSASMLFSPGPAHPPWTSVYLTVVTAPSSSTIASKDRAGTGHTPPSAKIIEVRSHAERPIFLNRF